MNEEIIITPDKSVVDTAPLKKDMRRTYNRCGWALFAVTAFVFACSLLLGLLMSGAGDGVRALYNKYLLILNEILMTAAFLFGMVFLLGLPKSAPERQKLTAKSFFTLLLICFAVSWVGNLIGTVWLFFWNSVTGNEATNQLAGIMMQIDPWQNLLCAGIIAPMIEEFFFRKLLIDRMHRHGELAAILTSAIFFGLFHQNFSQFFYAFGVGIVLGYIYCKAGSWLAATSLHVAFNMFRGVLPSLMTPKVLEFAEYVTNMTEDEMMNSLSVIVEEYGIALLLYFLYIIVLGILNIVGAILLLLNYKKININKNAPELTAAEKRKSVMLNSGIIAAAVIMFALMVMSLFTT